MKKKPDVLIDLTRLINRFICNLLPTGIDRVTLAYLNHYEGRARAFFLLQKKYYVFSREHSIKLFNLLKSPDYTKKKLLFLLSKSILLSLLEKDIKGSLFFNTDHRGLNERSYQKLLHRLELKPVYMLHDLIPIQLPEYCRPGEYEKHKQRINTMLSTAMGIITNSEETLKNLKDYAKKYQYKIPPTLVAPLSVPNLKINNSQSPLTKPYFLMLSTIEPRKNHWILLQVWKKLYQQFGEDTPHLVIIGKRGWAGGHVINLLERSNDLSKVIIELNVCDDDTLSQYLKNAQALLFPSFAEGFGLPPIEAFLFNTPVILSNLDVFKEIVGDIPEYIDPIDGKKWQEMIIEYSNNDSIKRQNQIKKIKQFTLPTWQSHFKKVDKFIKNSLNN